MQDLDDLLQGLEDNHPTTDVTKYTRLNKAGEEVTDHEIIEVTNWQNGFPETQKIVRYAKPLFCGHQVDNQDHKFCGYCRLCSSEYCVSCFLQCPRCGISVSVACCAKLHKQDDTSEAFLICKICKKKLKRKALLSKVWTIITHPFVAEEPDED
jgi:hypothetical protein